MPDIFVKHNIEVAHRLSLLPGKCQQIHGHSMQVTMYLNGGLDNAGVMEGLDFGVIKKAFREHLDEAYDHHLLLNRADPWAQPIMMWGGEQPNRQVFLPGLVPVLGDPTVELIARWIFLEMRRNPIFGQFVDCVSIQETNTNGAAWGRFDEDGL